MSKRLPTHLPVDKGPAIWRTLSEKADPQLRSREATEESAVQAASALLPEQSLLGRRGFLAVGGATAAAVGLSGCLRRPAEQILPYSHAPEYALPGVPLHFATAIHHQGETLGLLVESHEGRPTKIEGNPAHPGSLGATDATTQARIFDLYDPDRSGHPRQGESAATWPQFYTWWREKAGELSANGGRGLRLLVQPTDSPSFLRARAALRARFPEAEVHTWSPVSYSSYREGARLAVGEPLTVRVDYSSTDTVLALDCDFLGSEPGSIRNARGFASRRSMDSAEDSTNRLYVVESTLSLTGMNADHRLRLAPSQVERYLRALAAKLATMDGVQLPPAIGAAVSDANTDGIPAVWLDTVAAELVENRRRGAIVVGWRQPARVHALALALNAALGNIGATVSLFDPVDADEPENATSLTDLVEAMSGGSVDTLIILDGNPVYDAPGFAAAMAEVAHTVHLASHDDETSAVSSWHLPLTHELESWGDHRASDGTVSIQQPLIAPLRGGISAAEMLALVGGLRGWRAYHLVQATLSAQIGAANFQRAWRSALHNGVVNGLPRARPRGAAIRDGEVATALTDNPLTAADGWDLSFVSSYQTYDGREANNPWLLEMPDPVTKVVWDNAAYISPTSARELGLSVTSFDRHSDSLLPHDPMLPLGEMITVSTDAGEITLPTVVLPGHPDRVVTLTLGFGRSRVGRNGNGAGVDVYPVRTAETMGFATGATVRKASGTYELVQTQDHHSMAGRPLAIDATVADYRERVDFPQWEEPTPSVSPLWTQVDYTLPRPPAQGGQSYELVPEERPPRPGAPPRYKWGYVVDLTRCTGCSACVVACQAENNIPVVGKAQVARGREMHWIRIDRYFVGDDVDNPQVALQPVGCQHCEEAPCENVCPVNATSHSSEGLNEMTYNRCIGTRYCMNNCPYKVRRFNFLDWHGEVPPLRQMQFNPNVTVRMRGVMEKCTYCVQRIQFARIQARQETEVDGARIIERRILPEEVQPACAQACPSEAITFGDLNDTESLVHRRAHIDRHYKLLASIGTQPRTTYLGKIRNPNPEMV